MPSLKAFSALDIEVQRAIVERVAFRERRFLALQAGRWKPDGTQLLLVGDRPAPSAPNDPTFHYTPFGALWNSSLWLNLKLHQQGIPEEQLGWVNAADLHGRPTDPAVLGLKWLKVYALGGNAAQWCRQTDCAYGGHVHHPSSWKRFHSKEPYPLIGLLDIAT